MSSSVILRGKDVECYMSSVMLRGKAVESCASSVMLQAITLHS